MGRYHSRVAQPYGILRYVQAMLVLQAVTLRRSRNTGGSQQKCHYCGRQVEIKRRTDHAQVAADYVDVNVGRPDRWRQGWNS
jgi:hypothetical protein